MQLINLYETKDVGKFVEDDGPGSKEHYDQTGFSALSRVLWVGPSNSGKTNALGNYVMAASGHYEQIIMVTSGIEEPIYQSLAEKLEKLNCIRFFGIDDLPTLAEMEITKKALEATKKKKERWLVVFDDLMNQISGRNEKKVRDYFTMMRKCGMDGHFLSQSWYDTDKVIRKNCEFACIFVIAGKRDSNAIVSDNGFPEDTNGDIARQMYKMSVQKKGDFFKIDRRFARVDKRYSRNFTDYFDIDTYGGHATLKIPKWYKKENQTVQRKRKYESEDDDDSDDDEEPSSEDESEDERGSGLAARKRKALKKKLALPTKLPRK